MKTVEVLPLSVLYEQDETAWLEIMATLAAEGRYAEMDHLHLSEYLADMAERDRREVWSGDLFAAHGIPAQMPMGSCEFARRRGGRQ